MIIISWGTMLVLSNHNPISKNNQLVLDVMPNTQIKFPEYITYLDILT